MSIHKNCYSIKKFFDGLNFKKDCRNKIDSTTFLTEILFALSEVRSGDRFSLSLLASKMGNRGKSFCYSRSGLWRKLGSNSLTKILEYGISEWLNNFNQDIKSSDFFLKKMGVKEVYVLDSTTLTLPSAAKEKYPGVNRNGGKAAAKVHALLNITQGSLSWVDVSPGKSHDSQHTPELKSLAGGLLLMDLGYFGHGFFEELIDQDVKFVSRIKSNSVFKMKEAIRGVGIKMKGKNHKEITRKRKGDVVEYSATTNGPKKHDVRVIGHWYKKQKKYHWYITNLKCDADCVYPIYRVRWQIEILFKSLKGFMSFGEIPSSNDVVIKNIILSRILSAIICDRLFFDKLRGVKLQGFNA